MKRLANRKNLHAESRPGHTGSSKRQDGHFPSKSKKIASGKPNVSHGTVKHDPSDAPEMGSSSLLAPASARSNSLSSNEQSDRPIHTTDGNGDHPPASGVSAAATAVTEPGTSHSDTTRSTHAESSGAATNLTNGGTTSLKGGAGSTFSSPAPSVRSLATTLTTIQSTGPTNVFTGGGSGQGLANSSNTSWNQPVGPGPGPVPVGQQSMQFSHQFPSSPPASAVPSHLAPQTAGGNPTTYTTATANNLLTDNASILTLASSSKRQRRHSLDTNASIRALAPSSLWGGSRESLPLSILSSNVGDVTYPSTPGLQHGRPSVVGIASPERASVYSGSGIAPALSSERNSFYAGKPGPAAEAGSIKSGFLGHGRTDSVSGSIGGASLPLASPRDPSFMGSGIMPGRTSRRSSGWVEMSEETDGVDRPASRKPSLHGPIEASEL